MVHHLEVSWKERSSGTGYFSRMRSTAACLHNGSPQQEGEDLTCWRKGDFWNDALAEARGTGTGTAVGGSLDSPSVEMGREGEHAGVWPCRWDLWKFSPNCPNCASEVGTEAVSHE